MLSVPPHSATSASPSMISIAPLTMAWKPEPHSRFSVSAGVSMGSPALRPMWRAR